jgi:hypothetical protein
MRDPADEMASDEDRARFRRTRQIGSARLADAFVRVFAERETFRARQSDDRRFGRGGR